MYFVNFKRKSKPLGLAPNGFKSIIFLSGFILPKFEDNGPDTKAMGATKLADAMDHSHLRSLALGDCAF